MIYPHPIRLAGPWEYARPGDDNAEGAWLPIRPDRDWELAFGDAFRGAVRLRRRFNRPARLDAHESVWIVFEGNRLSGEVRLNGGRLGALSPEEPLAEFEILSVLEPHNELLLDLRLDGRGERWETVRLEIRRRLPTPAPAE
ncbi:MAG: hypothetical protein JNG90_05195 [Planctomycetaceae bacterium]|nr:hypothetical protein [Planctomycetaceae bacterium]